MAEVKHSRQERANGEQAIKLDSETGGPRGSRAAAQRELKATARSGGWEPVVTEKSWAERNRQPTGEVRSNGGADRHEPKYRKEIFDIHGADKAENTAAATGWRGGAVPTFGIGYSSEKGFGIVSPSRLPAEEARAQAIASIQNTVLNGVTQLLGVDKLLAKAEKNAQASIGNLMKPRSHKSESGW